MSNNDQDEAPEPEKAEPITIRWKMPMSFGNMQDYQQALNQPEEKSKSQEERAEVERLRYLSLLMYAQDNIEATGRSLGFTHINLSMERAEGEFGYDVQFIHDPRHPVPARSWTHAKGKRDNVSVRLMIQIGSWEEAIAWLEKHEFWGLPNQKMLEGVFASWYIL